MPTKHLFVKHTFEPVISDGGGTVDRISSIALTLGKSNYTVGETFDLTGTTVVATYLSGKTEDVTASCTFNPAEHATLSNMGSIVVTATYVHGTDTYTATQNITISDALSSISMTAPTKTSYTEGETLDLTGVVVTATYVSGATADVTSSCTFSPANGATLSTVGTQTITATYVEGNVTKTATVSVTVAAALTIVSWADGTDEEIAAMLNAHYDDSIDFNIYDHWKEGDKRNVQLSAMAATGVGEAHVAQTVTMVLVNKGGRTLSNGKECAFIWQQENCLANGTTGEWGYMNSTATNVGGWKDCARRTWCNSVYYNALPTGFKTLVKQCTNKTSKGNQLTTFDETQDYCFLPAEFEVQGAKTYAVDGEATTQWGYYKMAANKVKKAGSSGSAYYWWLRSPYSTYAAHFCRVDSNGTARAGDANDTLGIAVAGCI